MGKTHAALGFRCLVVATAAALPACGPESAPTLKHRVIAEHDRYFPALDETVRFVTTESERGSTHKYAVRASGETQPAATVRAEERSAHRARFGQLDAALASKLETLGAGETIRVTVSFTNPGVAQDTATPSDTSRDRNEHELAEWKAQLRGTADELMKALESLGAKNVKSAELVPLLFADATAAQIRLIGELPDVTRVGATSRGQATELSPPATPGNSMTVPGIDQHLNPSITGAGQAIGVVEDAGCRLFLEHDAMQGVDIQTQDINALPGCQTSVGCANACESQDSICEPSTLQCIDAHAGRLTSTIAQRLGMAGDYGAWEATIYHPTRGDGSRIKCSDEGIANAYDWLESRSSPAVGVTTESFFCESEDGLAQDYYARYHGFTVFRAAGNEGQAESTLPGCRPMNSVCVGGIAPASGGGFQMWGSSHAANPATTNGDREEPDVVALAQDVDLIATIPPATINDPLDVSSWATRNGTSYAAPAMATLAVLMREACSITNPRVARAMIMNSAWSINPAGPPYSTPQGGQDFLDGAGGPTADNLLRFCPGSGGDLTTGVGDGIADNRRGEDAPPWMEEGDDGFAAQGPGLHTLGPNANGLPFKIQEIIRFDLNEGDRVRVTFTWDSCPGSSPVGTGPGDLEADLDLFLCDWDAETCLAKSRSFDNNVEGFDVEVPAGAGTATYSLHYGWDPDSPFCDNGQEPWGYAYVYGRSSFFD